MMFNKMILYTAFILLICSSACLAKDEGVTYNTYTGKPATTKQLKQYQALGATANCTLKVSPCDPDDWRRVDGSCNNLKHIARGTFFVPMYRMLPPVFHNGNEPKKSISGKDLEIERTIRLKLLPAGKSVSEFTLAMPGYGISIWIDIGSVHDSDNLLAATTNCCEPGHYNDKGCASTFPAADDPVHRFDGLKCMNMTKPLFYQDFGCTKDKIPSPIAKATPSFDLSQIYNALNESDTVLRAYEDGLLIIEEDNKGRTWPINGPVPGVCLSNLDDETRCFKHQRNALLSTSLNIIYFYRHHNYIAKKLAKINPCWDDETLYNHAKDINTAVSLQIYLYEWMTSIIGRDNLVKSGVIMDGDSPGFRDLYDDTLYPMVSAEFSLGMRWFHIMQETDGKMFTPQGEYVKSFPIVNVTLRTGIIDKDQNLEYFTQGFFRQATSNYPNVDYGMAEQGFGPAQRAMDIPTNDLKKSRFFGFAPFVNYVHHCTGIKITSFQDLIDYDIIFAEKVPLLMDLYEDVRDIDLFAGMWVEKPLPGGWIPNTMACIMEDNMLRAQKSDRFWYERPNRPHAFTAKQLSEIRKMTYASLLCAVADQVTEVQPNAFRVISADNPLTSCCEIPQMDFRAWAV